MSFKSKFTLFSIAITALATLNMLRNMWAWPEAPWQTNFLFMRDIDLLLSGKLSEVTWYEIGSGHSLNGYRWFEYLNAYFFGLNSHLETLIYWILQLAIALTLSWYLLSQIGHNLRGFFFATLIALIILSPFGAGSRGMEIGQFFGIAVISILLVVLNRTKSNLTYLITMSVAILLLVFTVLGGYVGGWAVGLSVAYLFFRKTLDLRNKARLLGLASISTISAVAFALAVRLSGSSKISEGPAGLLSAMNLDPLFPIKYLLIGNVSALANSQSLENLPAWASVSTYYLVAAALAVLTTVILQRYKKRAEGNDCVPISLASYGFGTAITLMFYRPFGAEWLLSPWYGPHFKLGLAGLIIVAALLVRKDSHTKITRNALLGLAAISIIVGGTSWIHQIIRQPFERDMFLSIAKVEMNPELLVEKEDGLTQLIVPYVDSVNAIEIMKRHSLGVYRLGGYELNKEEAILGYVFSGDIYSDGWIGERFVIIPDKVECKNFLIKFWNVRTESRTVHVTVGEGTEQIHNLRNESSELKIAAEGEKISFYFPGVTSPLSKGESSDDRPLASRYSISCR